MSSSEYTIAPGSWVLVTGANGFIASHVINVLLSTGYKVKGTVRSEKPWLNELFQGKYGQGNYKNVIVPELSDERALDDHLQDVCGVIHVASNMSFTDDPNAVIPLVVAATENILASAARFSSVKRVVLTSSAVTSFPQWVGNGDADFVADVDTWSDLAIKMAWDANTPAEDKAASIYAASKAQGERAAWKWVEEHKPQFVLNTVLPNVNVGEIFNLENQSSSMGLIRLLFQGSQIARKFMPAQYFVNVEDTGRLHAIALLDPNVRSERIFACAAPFTWVEIIGILKRLRPDNTSLPDVPTDEKADKIVVAPSKRAEDLLKSFYGRPGWTSLEESLVAGIGGL